LKEGVIMEEIIDQYGEVIVYIFYAVAFIPMAWCMLRVLGTI